LGRANVGTYGGAIWASYGDDGVDRLTFGVGNSISPLSNMILTIKTNGGGAAGGRVGVGYANPEAQMQVYGTGQPTTAYNTVTGSRGGELLLSDTSGTAGSGGAITFGWSAGCFCGIKGYILDGAGYTVGSMMFMMRTASANATLTTVAQFNNDGSFGIGRSPGFKLDVGGNINCTGQYLVNGVPLSTGGGVTVQSVVTASRARDVVYQNSTGKAMFVTVVCYMPTGSQAYGLTDGANPPSTYVLHTDQTAPPAYITHSFWVLPGAFYKLQSGGTVGLSISSWTEWY